MERGKGKGVRGGKEEGKSVEEKGEKKGKGKIRKKSVEENGKKEEERS